MNARHKMSSCLLVVLLLWAGLVFPASAQSPLATDDQIIDEAMSLGAITGADDLLSEVRELAQQFVNDSNDYGGIGYNFIKSAPVIAHYRGSRVSTLAMIVPLLPGTVSDGTTLRGKMAARLKTEVTNYLLNQTYWNWEYSTGSAAPYVSPANPRISLAWNNRWVGGPHWEKMHALWAYAYYTGDWSTIQSNWAFIKARYQEGNRTPGSQQRALVFNSGIGLYRNAGNDLANGLIGYVRMATHLGDSTASQARGEAKAALVEVRSRLDVSWRSNPATVGWDNTATTMRNEWTPGYNLTPELGRWINSQALATAQNRLDEAANSGELSGHWWAGYINNAGIGSSIYSEDQSGMPNLAHELFLGRAWMLQESGATLRPMKPWHVVMGRTPEYEDILYYRSLYALISRFAAISWVPGS